MAIAKTPDDVLPGAPFEMVLKIDVECIECLPVRGVVSTSPVKINLQTGIRARGSNVIPLRHYAPPCKLLLKIQDLIHGRRDRSDGGHPLTFSPVVPAGFQGKGILGSECLVGANIHSKHIPSVFAALTREFQ